MEGHAEKFNKAAARFKESLTRINNRRRTAKTLGPEFVEKLGRGKRIKVVPTTTTTKQQPIEQQHTSSSINVTTQCNNNTNHANNVNTSFRYPAGPRGYTVTAKDEECLKDGQWLNDAIINVVLSWVHHEVLSQKWSSTIRVLDSMWYESATRGFPAGGTDALVDNMKRMQKWFPAGHPFDGRMTVIPVCQQHHWFAIVAIEIVEGWLVTVMDSLNTQTSQTAKASVVDVLKLCWPQKQIGLISCTVPQQDNMSDCGLHLIRNVGRIAVWITTNHDSTWDALEEFLKQAEPVSRATLKALMDCMATGKNSGTLRASIIGTQNEEPEEGMAVEETEKTKDEVAKPETITKVVEAEESEMVEEAKDKVMKDEGAEIMGVDGEYTKDLLIDDLFLSESESESDEGFSVAGYSHVVRGKIRWIGQRTRI